MKNHSLSLNHSSVWLGAAAGAAAMYLFDPRLGHRRRVLVRDQLRHARNRGIDFLSRSAYDLVQRGRGWFLEASRAFREGQIEDDVLVARVRARLGRCTNHPRLLSIVA